MCTFRGNSMYWWIKLHPKLIFPTYHAPIYCTTCIVCTSNTFCNEKQFTPIHKRLRLSYAPRTHLRVGKTLHNTTSPAPKLAPHSDTQHKLHPILNIVYLQGVIITTVGRENIMVKNCPHFLGVFWYFLHMLYYFNPPSQQTSHSLRNCTKLEISTPLESTCVVITWAQMSTCARNEQYLPIMVKFLQQTITPTAITISHPQSPPRWDTTQL